MKRGVFDHESAPWIGECSYDMNMYMLTMQIAYNYIYGGFLK